MLQIQHAYSIDEETYLEIEFTRDGGILCYPSDIVADNDRESLPRDRDG